MIREYLEGGKMIGHPIEAATKEEAMEVFAQGLKEKAAERDQKAAVREVEELLHPGSTVAPEPRALGDSPVGVVIKAPTLKVPEKNPALNGRKFLALEFQCSACGAALEAVFKDGFLQIAPCPTCLGELENMIAAGKRFLDRKHA